ncbi:MAG: hypothetical protein ACXU8O_02235 [Asticcacaulis sp.]
MPGSGYDDDYDNQFLGVLNYDLNSNNIITYWGGHAYEVRVFSLVHGKISLTLDVGSYDSPSIRKLKSGETEIVTTEETRPGHGKPHIYRLPLKPAV